jgi:hypothetical protein
MIEVSFDGTNCTVSGPSEVPTGNQVFKFTNSSGQVVTPLVGRNYPGKTWQDVLDAIGTPGTDSGASWNFVTVLGVDRSVSESPTVSYRQYGLKLEAEHHIALEGSGGQLWPCGPFHVVAAP